jgi:hypothetical protein
MKVICCRTFDWVDASGKSEPVDLQIGEPFPDTLEGGDWACSFQIEGAGLRVSQTMYGVDSLQAFMFAVQAAEAHLLRLERLRGGRIEWLGLRKEGFYFSNPLS